VADAGAWKSILEIGRSVGGPSVLGRGLRSGLLTCHLAAILVRDAAAYLNHPDRRQAVRRQLAETINRLRPDVIIAHSLGSFVTYEVLSANPAPTGALLITAGSPLAMPGAIFDHLKPPPTPNSRDGYGVKPSNVRKWINLADPGDIVAIPRPLHRRFRGIEPTDDHTTSIGMVSTHSFTSYLAHPLTSRILHSGEASPTSGQRPRPPVADHGQHSRTASRNAITYPS
jgi:alpha/beta hydrolase family protein